ncbi:hypothetical protein EYF88_01145 [Paracoccus sediminis]|uniref:Membrane-bound lysozyme-inhibitor of c-type lysozyme n=1 Tax=Paracoccus sediminis TaxID=1214787 RepID=A0A238USX6_9RHOB|nr:hypothetical protein [Paracoccus sediminis]TBN52843.1 hypothetical protein EYF88_01145 [Paracoccus sediminis]SNR25245.1 hypothetical protein SAMN06265378_101392 [Paracoccus sediminis]
MNRTVLPPALFAALFLTACQAPPTSPRPTDQLPFMGRWDCGTTTMTFTPETYQPSADAPPMTIRGFSTQNRVTTMTLDDGAVIQVQSQNDNQISWLSESTGDSLACKRVAG